MLHCLSQQTCLLVEHAMWILPYITVLRESPIHSNITLNQTEEESLSTSGFYPANVSAYCSPPRKFFPPVDFNPFVSESYPTSPQTQRAKLIYFSIRICWHICWQTCQRIGTLHLDKVYQDQVYSGGSGTINSGNVSFVTIGVTSLPVIASWGPTSDSLVIYWCREVN